MIMPEGTNVALIGAGAVGGTLILSRIAKADDERKNLETRINQIEAMLKEAGIGPEIGWADKVDEKLVELDATIQKLKSNDLLIQDAINNLNGRLNELNAILNSITVIHNDILNKINTLSISLNTLSASLNALDVKLKDFHSGLAGEFNAIGNEIIHEEDFEDVNTRSVGQHFINISKQLKFE